MSTMCKLSPTIKRRNGMKVEEVDSKLFADIKRAVKDYETSWNLWALSKTSAFKDKYGKDVEYDELGEVTFPSLIKVLGLQDLYEKKKDAENVTKDYGFDKTTYPTSQEAISAIEDFNRNEKKFVASVTETMEGFKAEVAERNPISMERARKQSFNYALTGEIITLLQNMGFRVGFAADPKFKGIFDPENATMEDGLLTVIRIAEGREGEEALPEEFSHLIIEGLSSNPLVQRLLNSLDDETVRNILGDSYDAYNEEYEGDMLRLKKEAAGKLLAEYIKKQGTIEQKIVTQRKPLLARIWQFAKDLFKKITRRDVADARNRAYNKVAPIYQMLISREVLPLLDKHSIMSAEKMYLLQEEFNSAEKLAQEGLRLSARRYDFERKQNRLRKTSDTSKDLHKAVMDKFYADQFVKSLHNFIVEANHHLMDLQSVVNDIEQDIRENESYFQNTTGLKLVAQKMMEIQNYHDSYGEFLGTLSGLDSGDNYEIFLAEGAPNKEAAKKTAEDLAKEAAICSKILSSLMATKAEVNRRIVYNYARTVYTEDQAKNVGTDKDKVMSLEEILNYAEKDISFADRWLSAMSDASDPLLAIVDGLVKNQQFLRDIELIDIQARIAKEDQDLRKAGYNSDFMSEIKDGVPTGRIISPYDWEGFKKAKADYMQHLRDIKTPEEEISKKVYEWKKGTVLVNGKLENRMLRLYTNKEDQMHWEKGETDLMSPNASFEFVPNPKVFKNKVAEFEALCPANSAKRKYYDNMMEIKMDMFSRIPHTGQHIFNSVIISKDFVEGILDNSTGNIAEATFDAFKRKFVRRPDDLGFGAEEEDIKQELLKLVMENQNSEETADKIMKVIEEATDNDIIGAVEKKRIVAVLNRNKDKPDYTVEKIIDVINSENFYIVETNFANQRVQRLPVYYNKRLKNMKMMSTDFSGTLLAYASMAINHQRMDEVVDILEVIRNFVTTRDVREMEGDQPLRTRYQALEKVYRGFVTKAGLDSAIKKRLDDYLDTVVYDKRKLDQGSWHIPGTKIDLDVAKTLDTIKDYNGILMLGFNIFSTFSNIAMGKLQQWIEASAREHFDLKSYVKAIGQYNANIWEVMAEMSNPIKHNKLSLLIQMFDPMKDYYESLRDPHFGKTAASRVLGMGVLGYIGMNAGEHMLRCQTMLAILNFTKLVDVKTGEEISLYDALEVKTDENGISHLELKPGLAHKKELIDKREKINGKKNKNYRKPLRDDNGKIQTELVELKDGSNEQTKYIFRKKKEIGKVCDLLNGAFGTPDKGAAHRNAWLRQLMQFRQWMPAHYSRRFAAAHYDSELEMWREGYYRTMKHVGEQLLKDIAKAKLNLAALPDNLSEHEKANLRRAVTELSMYFSMMALLRFAGNVKDKDRGWWEKMVLYQMNRMKLELGASIPWASIVPNFLQIAQKPAASVDTFEKFERLLHLDNAFHEIQSGRYQGWWEIKRDLFKLAPGAPQILKAWDFDESMFSQFD